MGVGQPVQPRLPWPPLYRRMLRRAMETNRLVPTGSARHVESLMNENLGSIVHLAEVFDINAGQLHRWKREGVPLYAGDRFVTTRLGLHPIEVWADDFYVGVS